MPVLPVHVRMCIDILLCVKKRISLMCVWPFGYVFLSTFSEVLPFVYQRYINGIPGTCVLHVVDSFDVIVTTADMSSLLCYDDIVTIYIVMSDFVMYRIFNTLRHYYRSTLELHVYTGSIYTCTCIPIRPDKTNACIYVPLRYDAYTCMKTL